MSVASLEGGKAIGVQRTLAITSRISLQQLRASNAASWTRASDPGSVHVEVAVQKPYHTMTKYLHHLTLS